MPRHELMANPRQRWTLSPMWVYLPSGTLRLKRCATTPHGYRHLRRAHEDPQNNRLREGPAPYRSMARRSPTRDISSPDLSHSVGP
jgi:hypothetical protein